MLRPFQQRLPLGLSRLRQTTISRTNRSIILPGVGDHLTADVTAQSFGGRIEAGYRVPVMATSGVTPYAAFQAQSFRLPSYGEADATGLAAFALTYNGHTFDEERSELGARFDSRLAVSDNSILLLRGAARLGARILQQPRAQRRLRDAAGHGLQPSSAPACRATRCSSPPVPNCVLPNGWTLRAKFDGSFAGQSQTYAGTGTLRFTWRGTRGRLA